MEPIFELGPIPVRVWPLPLEIPMKYLVEEDTPEAPTEYDIQYIYYYNGINYGDSEVVPYVIDRTPPYKVKPDTDLSPGAASWPADLGPNVTIDQDYIDSHSGGITITAAAYDLYYDPTDRIKVFWGGSIDVERDQPVFEGLLPSSYEVTLDIGIFENSVEDRNALAYIVTDLAGNISKRSSFSYRYVKLTDPPTVFDPPILPLANGDDGDDLIDLGDCAQGVDIIVTVPTPYASTDTIVAYWGAESLGEKSVNQQVNGELIWEDVDFSIIEKVYGNTDGDKPVNISYVMFRGTNPVSLGGNNVDINVNIFTVGPPNPDKPSLVNPLLDYAYLTTTGGSTDEILETDYGDNNVIISIPLFASPPTQEGWLIDVFYDDVKVGDTILLSNNQEGTTLPHPLPWQTIYDQHSGTKGLRWVLYTEDNPNPVQSRTKDVDVAPFPIELAEPEVLGLDGAFKNVIACATLNYGPTGDGTARHNLRVLIPKSLPYTVDGETITLSWAAYRGSPPVLIPGTETTESFLISGTYPDAGEVLEIGDYNTHFLPADDAYGRLSYTITRTNMADTPPSLEAEHYVFLINGAGQYCHEVTYPAP